MREPSALLVACLLLLVGLNLPLTEPDEVRYTEIPANMIASGDLVVPQLHGEPYLDKPPLHYWLVAGALRLFGPRPELSRLPSVLATILCALALYAGGRSLFDRRVALTAAAVFLVLPGVQFAAHYANLDATFSLWTTVCQLCLWLAWRSKERTGVAWTVAAGLGCGLAILTKGPVALAIAVPPPLAWDWLRRRRPRWAAWILFGSVTALTAAPWFLAISRRQPDFWHYFIVRQHLERFAGTLENQQPWWFFLPVLFIGIFPLTLLSPGLLASIFTVDRRVRLERTDELGVALLAAVWPILFFSFSGGKLASYILPSFPFIALLFAWYLRLGPRRRSRIDTPQVLMGSLGLSILLAWITPRFARAFAPPATSPEPVVWVLLWAFAIATCWIVARGLRPAALLAALLIDAQLLLSVLPPIAKAYSPIGQAATQALRLRGRGRPPLVLVADSTDVALLRPRYPVPLRQLHPADHARLKGLLEAESELVVVSEADHLAWLDQEPGYDVERIDRCEHVFEVRRDPATP